MRQRRVLDCGKSCSSLKPRPHSSFRSLQRKPPLKYAPLPPACPRSVEWCARPRPQVQHAQQQQQRQQLLNRQDGRLSCQRRSARTSGSGARARLRAVVAPHGPQLHGRRRAYPELPHPVLGQPVDGRALQVAQVLARASSDAAKAISPAA